MCGSWLLSPEVAILKGVREVEYGLIGNACIILQCLVSCRRCEAAMLLV